MKIEIETQSAGETLPLERKIRMHEAREAIHSPARARFADEH
jgi:hypothetical protein